MPRNLSLCLTLFVLLGGAATAEPPTQPVATFHDGVQRVVIDAELLGDFMAHKGAPPTADPSPYLEPLATLLRLQAEARREPSARLDFERRVAEERLLAADYRRRALAEVEVPEEQVEARLEQRRQEMGLRRPKKVHVQNLFKRLARDADPEARAALRRLVDELRQELVAGADFDTLAKRESDSQTAQGGGRMGVVRAGDLPKPLEAIVFALAEGEVSEVVENDRGFLLFRAIKIVPLREVQAEEASELIRQELLKKATDDRLEQMRKEVLGDAEVVIDLGAAHSGSPEAVAARFRDQRLTGQQVAWLSRMQAGAPALKTLHEGQLRTLVERHLVQAELARRERSTMGPELRGRLRWKAAEVEAAAGLRRRVQARFAPPTEPEVRAYFAANPDRFIRREHYRLQILRVDTDLEAPREAGRQVSELARQIDRGDIELAEAATRYSDHWSAKDGGHVGWWGRKRLASHGPFVMRAVTALEPGQTTQPIRQDRSWWIVRLHGVQPRRPLTFEEARVRADRLVGNEKLAAVQGQVEERIAQEVELEIVEAGGGESPESTGR